MISRFLNTHLKVGVVLLAGALGTGILAQQPPAANAPPAAGGIPQASRTPIPYDDYTGYTKIWDGQTFKNWDGEMDIWSIDRGALHADTVKTPGQHHIHYVGPGAVMKDFDLKVEMKMSAEGANGGIQYRSRLLHPAHGGSIANPMGKDISSTVTTLEQAIAAGVTAVPAAGGGGGGGRGPVDLGPGCPAPAPNPAAANAGRGGGGGRGAAPAGGAAAAAPPGGRGPQAPNPWQVSGYQFDMSSDNRYTGQLYEGQGRGIVNWPGGFVILQPCRVTQRIGAVSADPASAVKPFKGFDGEWNQIEIIARGNTLIHMINGQVITVTIDENPTDRAMQGILSLQLEGSGQIWYRNVYVKPLN